MSRRLESFAFEYIEQFIKEQMRQQLSLTRAKGCSSSLVISLSLAEEKRILLLAVQQITAETHLDRHRNIESTLESLASPSAMMRGNDVKQLDVDNDTQDLIDNSNLLTFNQDIMQV